MKWFWYYFGLTTSYLFNLCFLRTKVFYEDENRRNRRIRGKAIIISNHQNPLDGLVIAHKFFSRRINYIAADFFKGAKRALVPFIRVSGAVIVDRESYDFSFFEESKRLLNRNKLVLVFPEGRMTFDYEPTRFIYSYVALSIQSGAKIVPVVSDCNYRSFGRVHIIVGNSIEPSQYIQSGNLTKEKLKEANESIYQQFIRLYYQLKKKKYDRFKSKYIAISPKPGDIIRIFVGTHYHYGVYLSGGEVVQFGYAVNNANERIVVNLVSMNDFCSGRIPEVRVLTKGLMKYKRNTDDIIAYARRCVGQEGYNASTNNCADFANRVVFR